jgi:hypothetical protein
MTPTFPSPLWSRRDRVLLIAPMIGGAALIAWSWVLVAGRDDAGAQLAPLGLSMAGAGLGFAASLMWLGQGRRSVRALSWLLLGSVEGVATDVAVAHDLVAGPAARYFHRADCLLVAERAFPVAPRPAHDQAGRQPCPACRP